MSLIQVARYSDVKYDFKDGYACVPVLEGAFDQARFAHCALQSGHSITPDVYSVTEHNQLFIFTKGKGYIVTPRRVFNITEVCVFVPDFDKESFTFHCAADAKETMEIVHFVTELNDYDKTCLREAHMSLPRFRGVSEAWHYKENFTGADIQQMMLLEHRNLGRLSMGANFGTGPNYIGQHIHNELEQWYIMLPGASFTYTAEDEKIHVEGGDITFTPHGSHHGSECAEGERFAYVWFELCENGYPGEIK